MEGVRRADCWLLAGSRVLPGPFSCCLCWPLARCCWPMGWLFGENRVFVCITAWNKAQMHALVGGDLSADAEPSPVSVVSPYQSLGLYGSGAIAISSSFIPPFPISSESIFFLYSFSFSFFSLYVTLSVCVCMCLLFSFSFSFLLLFISFQCLSSSFFLFFLFLSFFSYSQILRVLLLFTLFLPLLLAFLFCLWFSCFIFILYSLSLFLLPLFFFCLICLFPFFIISNLHLPLKFPRFSTSPQPGKFSWKSNGAVGRRMCRKIFSLKSQRVLVATSLLFILP